MPNFFDQFDEPVNNSGNFFDQFDAPAAPEQQEYTMNYLDEALVAPQQPIQQPTEQDPSLMDRLSDRKTNIRQGYNNAFSGDLGQDVGSLPYAGAVTAGQTAGMGLDVIGEGISFAYSKLPQGAKEFLAKKVKQAAGTEAGQMVINAAGGIGGSYEEYKKENPEMALMFESNLGTMGLMTGAKGSKQASKGAKRLVGEGIDTASDVKKVATPKMPKCKTAQLMKKKV